MADLPFKIKICGVTSADDAQMVARAGADAIGLNFYPSSRRYLTPHQAAEVAAAIPAHVTKVGVFVNASYDEVLGIAQRVPLDFLQFHGDEPPELLARLADRPILRAWRCGADGPGAIDEYLARCRSLGGMPRAILADAAVSDQYGGTGMTADWEAIAAWLRQRADAIPVVLAGGLTPTNVAAAIAAVSPSAVDTAGGVESAPGRKDARLVAAFVQAASRALAALQT